MTPTPAGPKADAIDVLIDAYRDAVEAQTLRRERYSYDATQRDTTVAARAALAALADPKTYADGRREALEEAARVAREACLIPPDGGEPTEAERLVCDEAERRIRALLPSPPSKPTDAPAQSAAVEGLIDALELIERAGAMGSAMCAQKALAAYRAAHPDPAPARQQAAQGDGPRITDDIVERVAKAMIADLTRKDGEHGCLLQGEASPDHHIVVRGHIDVCELARAALEAVAPAIAGSAPQGEEKKKIAGLILAISVLHNQNRLGSRSFCRRFDEAIDTLCAERDSLLARTAAPADPAQGGA